MGSYVLGHQGLLGTIIGLLSQDFCVISHKQTNESAAVASKLLRLPNTLLVPHIQLVGQS